MQTDATSHNTVGPNNVGCWWPTMLGPFAWAFRPRPHYTVFKRKRYCFVPFLKRFAATLIVSVRFRPSTLQRVSVLKTLLNRIFFYILPPFFLFYFPRNKVVPLRWPSSWSCFELSTGFDQVVFIIIVPPKDGKLRSFIISCSLFEKSKSFNRVKCAFKSVKRLKMTTINKEATRKRQSVILDTRGWVFCTQVVVLWWRHRFQIVSFSPSTLGKERFQTVPYSNRSTLESVFETIRFRWSFSAL